MRTEDLFHKALSLAPPWEIARFQFEARQHRLDISLVAPEGSAFPCPQCGAASAVHDSAEKTWRHLDFFQYQAFITARVPRVLCPTHGIQPVEVPWARNSTGTRAFVRV
jgi:transposase